MPPLAESTCSDSEAGAATLCEDPRLTEALVRVTQQLAGSGNEHQATARSTGTSAYCAW